VFLVVSRSGQALGVVDNGGVGMRQSKGPGGSRTVAVASRDRSFDAMQSWLVADLQSPRTLHTRFANCRPIQIILVVIGALHTLKG
jgi:hypothetical protein